VWFIGHEERAWVGLKNHDARRRADFLAFFDGDTKQLAMAAMHAIEISNGKRAAAHGRWDIIKSADRQHRCCLFFRRMMFPVRNRERGS
jgi:hypothetical protein